MNTITSDLRLKDHLGTAMVRIGIKRGSYRVAPGLYSLNEPDVLSPVFVSANYKLSFDILRKSLKDISCRILVLETRGINVWCAAGKGTFGTEELINRINETKLSSQINHKRLILPQLGAPGVEAHRVRRNTGFNIIYGPVEAGDISDFMKNNMEKNEQMRTKSFDLRDRMILTPIELFLSWKIALPIATACLLYVLFSFGFRAIRLHDVFLPALLGIFSGGFLTPMLLPWIPFRAFALKGTVTGLLTSLTWILTFHPSIGMAIFGGGLLTAASSFIGMNFTGSSTYTSLSGVKKEMKVAVPLQIGIAVAAVSAGFLISIFRGGSM